MAGDVGSFIWEYIGQIVLVGGGSGLIALGLIRFFGKKWIEAKFNEQLEGLRHAQAIELERLKGKLETLLSGAIKIQELEFKILPELWETMHQAFITTFSFLQPIQQHPGLDQFSQAELDDFLQAWDATERSKTRIRKSANKLETYIQETNWIRLKLCAEKCSAAGAAIFKYGIFLTPALREQLDGLVMAIQESLDAKEEFMREGPAAENRLQSWRLFKDQAKPLYVEIERRIAEQLRSHAQTI